jgi:hypothetical protein
MVEPQRVDNRVVIDEGEPRPLSLRECAIAPKIKARYRLHYVADS